MPSPRRPVHYITNIRARQPGSLCRAGAPAPADGGPGPFDPPAGGLRAGRAALQWNPESADEEDGHLAARHGLFRAVAPANAILRRASAPARHGSACGPGARIHKPLYIWAGPTSVRYITERPGARRHGQLARGAHQKCCHLVSQHRGGRAVFPTWQRGAAYRRWIPIPGIGVREALDPAVI